MDEKQVILEFKKLYGEWGDIRVFHAPGRVNLIGEYTDFNGGYVFPCALNYGIYAVCSKRDDGIIKLATTNFEANSEIKLSEEIVFKEQDGWANYPKGVIKEIIQMGYSIGGLNVLMSGNLQTGAGLSSSAAIEVLTAVMLKGVFNLSIDVIELVRLSQRAENNFVGMMCGIMDQFAVAMGKAEHVIKLNCFTLEYSYAPLVLNENKLIIASTNKTRGLLDSKYNERRNECETALSDLKRELDISCLCDIDRAAFDKYAHLIKDEICVKRARHVVYENQRTLAAVEALNQSDYRLFGKLLNESHESLKNDFDVTGAHLDALAESAQSLKGCFGSRMTGAGFGGCTVSIVEADCVDEFIAELGEKYRDATGLTADFYVASAGDGAKEVQVLK